MKWILEQELRKEEPRSVYVHAGALLRHFTHWRLDQGCIVQMNGKDVLFAIPISAIICVEFSEE